VRRRPALERGGTLPEGVPSPRARWSFISVALCPSSEAEFRPRVAGPTVLVGHWGHQGRGPLPLGPDCFERVFGLRIRLCFVFLRKKMGFPRFLGDPYGCPRQFS
jgi:hypothetical protein